MTIPNILRPSGGVGIKLTASKKHFLKVCGMLVIVLLFSMAFLFLFYSIFRGQLRYWVLDNLMYMESDYNTAAEQTVIYYVPQWEKLRVILSVFFLLGTCGILLLVEFVSVRRMKRQKERLMEDINEMTGILFAAEDIAKVPPFPPAYAEIETKLVQMKASMLRQQQLAKEETMRKNDLITYLAHDLKTPLTSVIGYLSLLDEAADMPEEQRTKYTRVALDKAYRLESLINEFFDITRYNLQTVTLQKEKTDLHYMLLQMAEEFYPLLAPDRKKIEIHAPEDITIYGDTQKLARVFNNILKNAVFYSYPDSTIDIFAENSNEKSVLVFRNEGKVIPKEKLEFIFQKFYRLDEARATNTGGAGLGLAIAKEIVTLHGGVIYADSNEQYTVFVVELPVG